MPDALRYVPPLALYAPRRHADYYSCHTLMIATLRLCRHALCVCYALFDARAMRVTLCRYYLRRCCRLLYAIRYAITRDADV